MAKQPALFTEAEVGRIVEGAQKKGAISIDVIKDCADKVTFRINLKDKTKKKTGAEKEKNQDKGNILSLAEYRAEQEAEKTSEKVTVF